jgi:hypothetical protein
MTCDEYKQSNLLSDIIDDDSCLAVFIEQLGNAPELFLSCSVPYLQFDDLALDLHHECSKLHTYGDLMVVLEDVLCQPLHYT